MRILRTLALLGIALIVGRTMRAADSTNVWTFRSLGTGEVEYEVKAGHALITNSFSITYGQATLTADRAEFDQQSGEVWAQGNVHLTRGAQSWTSDKIFYNFQTGEMSAEKFRTGQRPYYLAGEALVGERTNNVYALADGYITTDDSTKPGYRIRAKVVTVVPGEYIEARNATVLVGKVPVFWLPYMHKSLKGQPSRFMVTPGYRSAYGPFLLGTYHWYWEEKLEGVVHADYRGKRGPGVGPDVGWHTPELGVGEMRYYYTYDKAPSVDQFNNTVPRNRQRVWFAEQLTLQTNLTGRAVVRWESDANVTKDFFEAEYRQNVQPNSYVELNQDWANWNGNLYVAPQVNPFLDTIERLPDLKFSGLRQQLGESPFYYESESELGYFRHQFPNWETNGLQLYPTNNYAAGRADTYHQITLPQTFFGWLNVAPRVGGRFSYYSTANGPGATTDDQTRAVFNTGAEVSTKASRVWPALENRTLEMDGLRHIISPSVNYVYVPSPSTLPPRLPQFDTELPSYRLMPIEYPDYNSIDSVDSQNVMRFALRNKLQTKRKPGVDNLLNWALYTDWRLKPRSGQTTFADAYSDLDFKPRSWLTFSSQLRYNIGNGQFDESDHWATVHPPSSDWTFAVGHRYRRASDVYGTNDLGNNTIMSSVTYRLNENWCFRMRHHFEARDGVMEEQQYTIYRDLRSWTAALTFRVRGVRNGSDDFGVAVTFSLKQFPRYKLNSDTDFSNSTVFSGG